MNNYELKIQVNESELTNHYLKLNPYCNDWEIPETEELIEEAFQQLESIGITLIDEVNPEREIIGRQPCCMSPIYK